MKNLQKIQCRNVSSLKEVAKITPQPFTPNISITTNG